jgi:hypothetical protein
MSVRRQVRAAQLAVATDAAAIGDPPEAAAGEVVGAQRLEDRAAVGDAGEGVVKGLIALQVDRQRDGGSEGELVGHRSIDTPERAAGQVKSCVLDSAFGALVAFGALEPIEIIDP